MAASLYNRRLASPDLPVLCLAPDPGTAVDSLWRRQAGWIYPLPYTPMPDCRGGVGPAVACASTGGSGTESDCGSTGGSGTAVACGSTGGAGTAATCTATGGVGTES